MKTRQPSNICMSGTRWRVSTSWPVLAWAAMAAALFVLGCRQPYKLDGLERAVLAHDWAQVERETAAHATDSEFRQEASILRGYVALMRGDSAAAGTHFLRARGGFSQATLRWAARLAGRNPDSAVALMLHGDALARSGDVQAGLKRLDQAVTTRSKLAVIAVARATLRTMEGDRAGAADDLRPLVSDSALAAEALTVRALGFLVAEDLQQACADLQKAVALAPGHAVAFNALGIVRARQGDWVEAAHDFETAFRLAPELREARQNWQLAKGKAQERGSVISEQRRLGVFVPGNLTSVDKGLEYVKTHAQSLIPGPHEYVYIAEQGRLPNADVQRMRAQGIETLVLDPKNPARGIRELTRLYNRILDQGKSVVLFPDIHSWVPAQLGNDKTQDLSQFVAQAQVLWKHLTVRRGLDGTSVLAGHSDGTRVVIEAGLESASQGAPPQSLYLQTIRSENQVQVAVDRLRETRITVIQPSVGDFVTTEAQGRLLRLEPGAYQKTIETLKGIGARNYVLMIDESPTRGIWGSAHGDAANLQRNSQWSMFSAGKQTGRFAGAPAEVLNRLPFDSSPRPSIAMPDVRGGITLGYSRVSHAAGRVTFDSGGHDNGELVAVYTLFGAR